jgi:hypothetical protein
MRRAGVFIGVDRTRNMPELHDAAAGAQRMHQWALGQGMPDGTHAKLITDAGGAEVTLDQIYEAIQAIADGPGVDQLVVYFAGHGVNINLSEIWLLSEAPVRADAAVDLNASLEMARDGSIPHVVFISDTCRVAPRGAQAQRVRGQVIFPNDPTGQSRTIDRYFACAPTRTAAEARDPGDPSAAYVAVYTAVLLDVLNGYVPEALDEALPTDPRGALYVRGPKLKPYLASAVPERISALRLPTVDQDPDAIVEGYDKWLSQVAWEGRRAAKIGQPIRPAPPSLRDFAVSLVATTTAGIQPISVAAGEEIRVLAPPDVESLRVPGSDELLREVEALATPFDASDVRSRSGVRIRGRRVSDVLAPGVFVQVIDDDAAAGQVVEIDFGNEPAARPAASLLLGLEGGVGTLVPVIPGVITSLAFGPGGDLVDVSFDIASRGRLARPPAQQAVKEARHRAAVAVTSARGLLRPDEHLVSGLVDATLSTSPINAAMALYTAYLCHDGQVLNPVRVMADRLTEQLGVAFLDLELLNQRRVNKRDVLAGRVLPAVPLLSQGWSVVRGRDLRLVSEQETLHGSLLDSQWSLYDRAGCDVLRRAMGRGEFR